MSTQHRIEDDTNTLPRFPRIRSTAKKVGSWQLLQSEQPIDTSMVNKQFGDFDHSASDEDVSVEQGRGGRRSNRSTPGKVNSSLGAFNSLYDLTPPSAQPRKSIAAETGSLRRDETIRHFQDMTQEQTNEAMRLDNENLRQELAQLTAQHDEEARHWSKKQSQLRRKVDAAKEKEGLTREILSVRQANGQDVVI
jgi:hypothetical protein